ncbi:uncharacterized protein LOC113229180 [Hyposmocoma kahamanoa]|uniref:uncharacterized protein LOC113229180 n=1 Tax=Hyposmocoma kahamanoa TaxID=1477025 RepID=UPI000E6D5C44|nr:uncharacterized protein LOC113229180 [Hyposmocoma kahamanoa]
MFNQNEPKHRQEPLKEQFNTCVIPRAVRWARDFCLETSMHGFLHIAVQGRHWFERILWATITAAAIWGAIEISLGQWQRFNDNPTVVTLEKDFRNWRFSLPSITACDVNRVKASKLPEVIKKLWNIEPEHEKYDYYKRFVTTVANSDIFHLKDYKEFKDDHTLDVDLKQLVIDVLPDFLVKTTWSQPTDAVWTPVMTEAGICYNLNSLAIDDVAIV